MLYLRSDISSQAGIFSMMKGVAISLPCGLIDDNLSKRHALLFYLQVKSMPRPVFLLGQWNIAHSDWLILGVNVWFIFSTFLKHMGPMVFYLCSCCCCYFYLVFAFLKHLVFYLDNIFIASRILNEYLCLHEVIVMLSQSMTDPTNAL